MSASRFNRRTLLTAALLVSAVALFNLVVDPSGVYGLIRLDGFNAKKPAHLRPIEIKPFQIAQVRPKAVILGNSRVEIGLDPASPQWPDEVRPVYNFGIPGGDAFSTLAALRRAMAVRQPRLIVVGVDFIDGLAEGSSPAPPNRLRLLVDTLLSLDGFYASLVTLAKQGDPEAADLTPLGFNPLHEYNGHVRSEGHAAIFRQKNLEYARRFLAGRSQLAERPSAASLQLSALASLLQDARAAGTAVHMFIHPYHADLLESLRIAGLWPAFEAWKRDLTTLVVDHGGPDTRLWDFSGYHAINREPVPSPGDTKTEMRWYWEAGHYKSALGEVMLARMLAQAQTDVGAELTAATLEARLHDVRRAQRQYHAAQPADVARIRSVFAEIQPPRALRPDIRSVTAGSAGGAAVRWWSESAVIRDPPNLASPALSGGAERLDGEQRSGAVVGGGLGDAGGGAADGAWP